MIPLDGLCLPTSPAGSTATPVSGGRSPVHVVYGGAHLFQKDLAQKLGARAGDVLATYVEDDAALAGLGIDATIAPDVRRRVAHKLATEPVEDLRIDFEDGFGVRDADEEDRFARLAGHALHASLVEGLAPPFVGLRIKPLTHLPRAARTLSLFLEALGPLPDDRTLLVTLPKVEDPATAAAFATLLARAEETHRLRPRALAAEIMVEHPRAVVARGRLCLGDLVDALDGRCVAAHFGSYDWSSSLGIAAIDQGLHHPACDLGKMLAALSLFGTGVRLSDGATTTLPVPPHRAPATTAARDENRRAVRGALALHVGDVRRSLSLGLFQGWDLHPGQLVSRYAAVFAFYRAARAASVARLAAFVAGATQASRVGTAFDDAATARGLVSFLARGLACGALDADDVASSGLSVEALRRGAPELFGDP